jgi:DNA-binding Lrp family transcriptional regulator
MVKLDAKDRKLIHSLDFDARTPLSSLAKKIGLSKQVTKYRLDNLQKKGVIQGFYTDINPSRIGMSIYLVYFTFQNFPVEKEEKFIQHVASQKSVGVNVSFNGIWDYCIGIWAEDLIQFKDYYRTIMNEYEQFVKNKVVMIETDFYYFKPKQILELAEDRQISMTGSSEILHIDHMDRTILSKLSQNARMPLIELGKEVELTPNAVKQRIRNLERNGVILGYRVMINYRLLDFSYYRVFLHLNDLSVERESSIIEFLRRHKAILSVTKTVGYAELEFRAIVHNIDEFYELLHALRTRFPKVIKEYQSILYNKFHQALNYFPF